MRCWAETYCKKRAQGEECSEYCTAYVLLEALYTQSGMPKRYQYPQTLAICPQDAAAYQKVKEYKDNVVERVEAGDGLYLWGQQTGTGKTSLACVIMNEYFRKKAFSSNLECLGLYLHVPTFLEAWRMSQNDPDRREEMEILVQNALTAKLVIWDDIGAERPSEWVRERLLTVLDRRTGEMLANIFTSNLSVEQLSSADRLGQRFGSRVTGCTEQIQFKGVDRREVKVHG